MPTTTRTFIKTAFGYMFAGMLLSTLWLIQIAWPLHPLLGHLQPTALHLIVVGWLTQLIFGVALWMFPAWSKQEPRGPNLPSWICYSLLNTGLLLRLIVEPLNSYRPAASMGWLLLVAAQLQVAAVWLFALLAWPRVRSKHGAR